LALFYFPIESEDNIQEKLAEHSKVAVVYWSGTGNTETMAAFVAEGAKEKGGGCCPADKQRI
jgi:flavorubredoxin